MKRGISLVALIITIIVMVILTGAVIISAINVPNNASITVFRTNVATVQDAVTIKMLNNLAENAANYNENARWIGIADGYTIDDIANPPTFDIHINGVATVKLDASLKVNLSITDEEFGKYYVSQNGTVYHHGYTENGVTYYNGTASSVALTSIIITRQPTKTTYYAGNTVDMTGLEVIATYSDNTTEDVTNKVTFTPALEEATKSEGIKNIEVSYQGIKASNGIDLTFILGTLGEQITKDNYYDYVNYEPNGEEQWYIYYKGTVNGQEYIYLISKEKVETKSWSSYTPDVAQVEKVNNPAAEGYTGDLYNIMKLGQQGYVLDSTRKNSCCVAEMVNGYGQYATTSNPIYGQYVVGAIGGPTIELLTARGNEYYGREELVLDYTSDADGYKINDTYWWDLDTGILSSAYIWFASPSYNYKEDIIIARAGNFYCQNSGRSYGIHPVVCLKADVPAIWDGTKWNINIE